ncbi:MAG: hypothetical protein KIT10_08895 [Flavobacteriales bacterium]|nr:hypothetical protein [Flavobacteriales bacterium]
MHFHRYTFRCALLILNTALGGAYAQDLMRSWQLPTPSGVYGIQPADDGGAFISIHAGIASLARLDAAGDTVWCLRPLMVTHMGHNLHRHGDHLYLVGNIGASDETMMRVVHKYDLDGGLVWANGVTGNHDQTALVSRVLDDGSLLLCASIYTDPSNGPYRPVFSKFSADGDLLWSREHLLPSEATIYSIGVATDGTIWSVGKHDGDAMLMHLDATGGMIATHRVLSGITGGAILLQHVAPQPDGTVQIWARIQGGPLGTHSLGRSIIGTDGEPQAWSFYGTPDNDVPAGWVQRTDGSWVLFGNFNSQWVLASIGADGEVEQAMSVGEVSNVNQGMCIALDGAGHAWLGGTQGTDLPMASFARVALNGSDLCNVGPIAYQHIVGPTPSFQTLAPTTGQWGNPEAPMSFPYPMHEVTVLDPCGIVSVPILSKPSPTIWPNPVSDVLHFSEPLAGQVYNAQGQIVMDMPKTPTLDVRALTPGVYVLHTMNGSALRFVKE